MTFCYPPLVLRKRNQMPSSAPEPKSLLLLPYIPAHPMANLPDPHSSHNLCPQLCCAPAWHPKTPRPFLPGTLGSLGVLQALLFLTPITQEPVLTKDYNTFYSHAAVSQSTNTRQDTNTAPPTPTSTPRLLPTLSPAPQCCPGPTDPNSALTLNLCTPCKHGRGFHSSFL